VYSRVSNILGALQPDGPDGLDGIPGTVDDYPYADNGVLDSITGGGPVDLSLDLYIGFLDGPDMLLVNDPSNPGYFLDYSALIGIRNDPSLGGDVGDIDLDGDLDIVIGLDKRGVSEDDPVVVLVNDTTGTFPYFAFLDADDEASLSPNVLMDESIGDFGTRYINRAVRDIDLLDIDGDGDLDLFGSQMGDGQQFGIGALNFMLCNRVRGENFNAENIRVPRVPGNPVINTIAPAGAMRGAQVEILITGINFISGQQVIFDMGEGVSIISPPEMIDESHYRLPNVRIESDAPLGPRLVTISYPSEGASGKSSIGAFNVWAYDGGEEQPNAAIGWDLYE